MGAVPTLPTGFTHDRITCEPIMTVQAPHCAMPQPNCGAFSWSWSIKTNSSGVLGSTSTVCCSPLTMRTCSTTNPARRTCCLDNSSDSKTTKWVGVECVVKNWRCTDLENCVYRSVISFCDSQLNAQSHSFCSLLDVSKLWKRGSDPNGLVLRIVSVRVGRPGWRQDDPGVPR